MTFVAAGAWVEIDGDEIVGFSLAYLSDSNRTCSRFACVSAVLV